jgi:hypothetical protein
MLQLAWFCGRQLPDLTARRGGSPRDFGRTRVMAACSRFGQSVAALGKTMDLRSD